MTVALLRAGVRGRVTVDYFLVTFPILKLAHIFYILFQICGRPAIWEEEVGPCGSVQDRTDTLVVPYVGAGCYKQGLTWLCTD